MKKETFFAGEHNINDLISKTKTDTHNTPIRFGQSMIGGVIYGACPVYMSDALAAKVGGMVYGDGSIAYHYRLELVQTMGGDFQLFAKYNHILGSRRVASIRPASLAGFIKD